MAKELDWKSSIALEPPFHTSRCRWFESHVLRQMKITPFGGVILFFVNVAGARTREGRAVGGRSGESFGIF